MIIYPDKEKLLKEFQEKYVTDKWVYKFLEVDEMYKADKAAIEENLILAFEKVCKPDNNASREAGKRRNKIYLFFIA